MVSEVWEILRSLCYDTGWSYAVFWKLKQQMHKVLAWGEGFYEPIKLLEMPEALSSQSQHCKLDDRVGQTLERMSCRIYSVGEGIIGRVAFTNEHQWIFSFTEREYPTELHDQFAAGIQTVAMISVHQGVVQLGSRHTISEDLKLVSHVKNLFGALQKMEGIGNSPVESQREGMYGADSHSITIAAANTARMPAISDVWSSLAARGRHLNDEQGLHELFSPLQTRPQTILGLQRSMSMSSSVPSHQRQLNPPTPQPECISSQGQSAHYLLQKLGLDSLVQYSSPSLTTDEAEIATNATEKAGSSFRTESINCLSLDVTPPTMFRPLTDRHTSHANSCPLPQTGITSQLAFPIDAFSAGGGSVTSMSSGMLCSKISAQAHAQNMLVPSVESTLLMHHAKVARNDTLLNKAMNFDISINSNCDSENSFPDVQMGNLLEDHDLGELMFPERNLGEGQDLSSLLCDNVPHSLQTANKETEAGPDGPSDDALQRVFSSELDAFDNFIASLKKEQEIQDDGLTKSPFALLKEVSEVSNRSVQKASFWDPPMVNGSSQSAIVQRQVETLPVAFSSKLKDETSTSCQTVESDVLHLERFWKRPKIESLYRSSESSTVPGPHIQTEVFSASTQDEPLQAGKKRARSGENARPRPKDRQQIQDRVRELRSIIPSSAKCSIDALLEKTIKYMNFLQTMTEDADKWKDGKLQDYESNGDSNIREGGASWAVELGGQGRECPLIVEDLSQPQHLLVEMLCEETGIFLEIADTIKGLGLTILKGLMESRNEKMWARFVVKADEDVHRVHVVWSLMRLLESNTRTSSDITNLACG